MAWVDMREPSQSSPGGKVNVWCRSLDWSMAGGQVGSSGPSSWSVG
jgi:hypothetical protein